MDEFSALSILSSTTPLSTLSTLMSTLEDGVGAEEILDIPESNVSTMELVSQNLELGHDLFHGSNSPIEVSRRSGYESNEEKMKLLCHAASGTLQGLKKLLDTGVPIDAKDYNGRTSLMLAAQKGHLAVVAFLIHSGANINGVDERCLTALDLAKCGRYLEVQVILEKAGATTGSAHLNVMHGKESNLAKYAIMEAFPRPIAQAILEGRKIDQICKDNVSLFFSDIVGFTTMSSRMDAGKVSRMLNTLFTKFDKLAYRHGVQKVDIIGDAYVAATNFMEDQPHDHAARIARFAIDAMKAARETFIDEDNRDHLGRLCIRIGLHCGAVSGRVLGWHNFKYTLIGGTVSTAARMESTGAAGRIQCSDPMSSLITQQAHEMTLKPRYSLMPNACGAD